MSVLLIMLYYLDTHTHKKKKKEPGVGPWGEGQHARAQHEEKQTPEREKVREREREKQSLVGVLRLRPCNHYDISCLQGMEAGGRMFKTAQYTSALTLTYNQSPFALRHLARLHGVW